MKYNYRSLIITLILSTYIISASCGDAPIANNANLLANSSFESGTGIWSYNPEFWQIASDTSHSGISSLKVTNDNPSAYPLIIKTIPLQENAKYEISAWIKTENVHGSASIALIYFDDKDKYLPGGYYPTGVTGTSDWTFVTGSSKKTPSNAKRAAFILFMKQGSTGTAWFDDVDAKMVYDFNFRTLITSPVYRNTVYSSQPKTLEIGVHAEGNALHPTNSLLIDISVKDPAGKITSTRTEPALDSRKWKNIPVNIKNPISGKYYITAKLIKRKSGDVFSSSNMTFTIAPSSTKVPKVYIDQQKRCIVEGEPFFPLGFYCTGRIEDVRKYITRLSGTGFNCLMNYATATYSQDNIQTLLDTAENNDIKMIFSVKDCYDGAKYELKKSGPWTGSFNVLKGMVSTYKNHPAVLAWYLNDELTGRFLPQIIDRYNYISSTDPDHPVWQVLFAKQDIYLHVDNTDILGIDDYPVMRKSENPNIYEFGDAAKIAEKSTMSSRAVWMVPECSTIRYDSVNPSKRPPTYNEIMCETYQALTNGARGLIFFSLHDLLKYDGEPQWEIMKRIGDHLNRIKPVLLGDTVISNQITADDNRIDTLTRSVNGDIYILAVNPYHKSISVKYSIPDTYDTKRVTIERSDNSIKIFEVNNQTFTDAIEPYGTRLYKIIY
ncbi:MAG: carbohydrate binding domain-containing protein [Armatimonadota bacterium]